ncbi:MAG: hypothetical protein IPL31_00200 [Saprospiraceae bacterium]|nr:hypothetical protein [Saprospiraceae bacterium]
MELVITPDSAKASLITILEGRLVIEAGNGSITGVYNKGGINGSGIWEYYNTPVSNYNIVRCRIDGGIHLQLSCTNWNFIENVIHDGVENKSNGSSSFCTFYNNIFDGSCRWVSAVPFIRSVFKNNLFLAKSNENGSGFFPIFSSNSLYENNIFIGNDNNGLSVTFRDVNSIYNNNIFVENWGSPQIGSCNCLGSNNIINQSQSSIFVNQIGNLFNFTHNYHLQNSSSGKNAGSDGQDIGIYGGFYPWKEGSLPANPHMEFKPISNNTDQNGNLKINIKVKAQNN